MRRLVYRRALLDCSSRPLRTGLPSKFFLNRLHHELHERLLVGHTVQLETMVKFLRDARRQLRRSYFFRLCHQTSRLLVLRTRRTPRTPPTPPCGPGNGLALPSESATRRSHVLNEAS